MAISYKLYQDKRTKGGTQLFYARAIHNQTRDLDYLAKQIEHNTSMTKGDVKNVLSELVTQMKSSLQNSEKVVLNGFGRFYIGMVSAGADTEKDFKVSKHLKGYRVGFLPQGTNDGSGVTRTFLEGLTCQKAE